MPTGSQSPSMNSQLRQLYKVFSLTYILVLFFTCTVLSQSTTGQKSEPERTAVDFYERTVEHTSNLFNGREYIVYKPMKDEHPYLTMDWEEGDVLYDGQLYQGRSLLYDVSIDQLIAKYYNDDDIELVREKISYFTLGKRKFIPINSGVATLGFHELLFDGEVKVLAKFEKKFLEKTSGLELTREFEEKARWYFAYKGEYFTIKNKKSLLALFPDHRADLKKFIRENKLSFGTAMRKDLVTVAEFCEKFL
jgi:hypothetical protein